MTSGTHRIILDGIPKEILWNADKELILSATRGVTFEPIAVRLASGDYHAVIGNPNQGRYPGQRLFVVEVAGYAYLVPFAETATTVFLKTVIPSRKATRSFVRKDQRHDH